MLIALEIILYLLVAGIGACVFSFLNVLVYRIPRHLNWVSGRSMCPHCEHQLAARDLVPVFSWLALRGKCRYCGAPIRARYTFVELLGAVLALACVGVFGWTLPALIAFALFSALTTIAFIDGDTREIPDGLVVAVAIIGAAALICQLAAPQLGVFPVAQVSWTDRIIGIFVASVPLLVIALVTGGFGGGDIKLFAALGLALGWQLTLLALFFSVLFAGVYAIWLLAKKKAGRKTAFAFGPFICAAAIVTSLCGFPLISWYLGLFGL